MTVLRVLLRKELLEIRRTWRIWVLPAILMFLAITSPILAEITPGLVRSLAGSNPDIIIELPDPVALDSYRQLASQLNQIGLLALIIASAGIVGGELRSGTAILVLTKPVSRRDFIVSKVLANIALLVGATLPAAVVCWVVTLAIFGEAPVGTLAAVIGLWLVAATGMLCLMTLLSTLIPAQAGAAGVGIAAYAVLSMLALWEPARSWTPAGALHGIAAVIEGTPSGIAGAIASTVVLAIIAIAVAIRRFGRSELAGRAQSG
ncbi:MAG: ABC transporter permease [Thermomicrobiales bacterium]|nr:ABC transporter permease [Thermomicrobiales bacterium]